MNIATKANPTRTNEHHWMLWVSPSNDQIAQFKSWPSSLRERVLTLQPRVPSKLADNLIQAIETGYYAMITLPLNCLCELDEWRIKQSAATHNTAIAWKG